LKKEWIRADDFELSDLPGSPRRESVYDETYAAAA
jgi:hypothetical protein